MLEILSQPRFPLDLESKCQKLKKLQENFIGYPCNAQFDYAELFPFLQFPLNNIGDPYLGSNYALNTHEVERMVVETFMQLTGADAATSWGYCTNGGTEGNMYGLFLARELYADGIVYYSEETHYSVNKIIRCLNIPSQIVKTLPNGCMDLVDFKQQVQKNISRAAIVVANIGTTMKGACDNVLGIKQVLKELQLKDFYIHADAALSGMILPFVERAAPWNFSHGIDSISISGHKMIGSPFPCGIVVAKKANVEKIAREVEYVGSKDTTIPGSRNALAPLFLWYSLQQLGEEGLRQRIQQCLFLADEAISMMEKVGIPAWRHRHSITVVFPRPSDAVIKKWQLAVQGDVAHIITMPHVQIEHLQRFIADLLLEQEGKSVA